MIDRTLVTSWIIGYLLLRWIGKLFTNSTAVDRQRDDPVAALAVQHAAVVYSQIPLHEFINEERRSKLSRKLFLEINDLGSAPDSAGRCRERYVAAMLEFAAYQVLMVPPPPEEDHFGLRDQPGVTGELRQHINVLFDSVDELRSALFIESGSEESIDLWEFVQRNFWEAHWRLEALNAMRVALDTATTISGHSIDNEWSAGRDWHKAFLHAAAVNYEHKYRWELQLSSAFDESIAKEASTAYSVFTDIVLSGAEDPESEWRDYYQNTDIPMPTLD